MTLTVHRKCSVQDTYCYPCALSMNFNLEYHVWVWTLLLRKTPLIKYFKNRENVHENGQKSRKYDLLSL